MKSPLYFRIKLEKRAHLHKLKNTTQTDHQKITQNKNKNKSQTKQKFNQKKKENP